MEECVIESCVHAGIKCCHGKAIQNLSNIYFCIFANTVFGYILLNATFIIEAWEIYSTYKKNNQFSENLFSPSTSKDSSYNEIVN